MKRLLELFFSRWRWARRLHGGRWEEWWADPINAYVWIPVIDWTPTGKRPGGCAIWSANPAPRNIEQHR